MRCHLLAKTAASTRERIFGALMIIAVIVYMVPFVSRGWWPHDEGLLGQSADAVLRGGLPYIDYEEAYSGGLSWLYAGVFTAAGVDLLNIRWLLFIGAAWAAWLIYSILRRFLAPAGAGFATWIAITWSFPNYFAGLPSWWLLICALVCLWAMIRQAETGQWRYLVTAALAVGSAMAIKQTGVYLLVALVSALLYSGGFLTSRSLARFARVERLHRWGTAALVILTAAVILGRRIVAAEGLYLFWPIVGCASILLLRFERDAKTSPSRSPLVLLCVTAAVAALPLACLMTPYLVRHRLWDFVYGSVILPQRRLAFASMSMPDAIMIVTGIPFLVLVFATPGVRRALKSPLWTSVCWMAAGVLPIAALWSAASYQFIWQSTRACASLLPLGICWLLVSGRVERQQRAILFLSAVLLAWTSLNQFPFAAPIYFCYVAPLAVIAAVAAPGTDSSPERQRLLPWGAMLLLFAVLSTNRGYISSLGRSHAPIPLDAPLNLPRAHLRVGTDEAQLYRHLVILIREHLGARELIAGPDCPEVYYLLGLISPSGTMFDFFDRSDEHGYENAMAIWRRGDVIVLNHSPAFSRAPSERISTALRREFANGEIVGRFEVRWR